MVRFRALQDFYSPELQSSYVTGLTYTIREVPPLPPEVDEEDRAEWNRIHSLLAQLAPTWLAEGKIEDITDDPTPVASAAGVGTVS